MNAVYGWLAEASPSQRRILIAAALGWMLDSMDVMLYALVLGPLQRAMHMSPAVSGAMVSVTLISGAVGGILFGSLADRYGRTRALTWSISVYSIFTALCGLTQTPLQLFFCRLILGLGMGGEWASGAALVAESWPQQHRNKALALVQSAWAVGYGVGAAIVAIVLPHFGWRAVFFTGLLPAFITLWIRRSLHEPERPQHTSQTAALSRSELFARLRRPLLICAAMNAATLFGWWGLFTWVPHFLSQPISAGGRGLSIIQTSGFTIAMQTGAFFGYVLFGYIADRFQPKATYIAYLIAATILTPVFALVPDSRTLLFLGPLVGFFGTGYFSGFSILSSSQFPASIRASAMGFAYNIGRIASAGAPYLVGWLSQTAGLSYALAATAAAFAIAACIATTLTPNSVRD
ncbi:MAG TPA: MFS transporter [Acidobacteriaceae bacterium]